MHILFLPSWFETPQNPQRGSFFLEQAEAVVGKGHKVTILYLNQDNHGTSKGMSWYRQPLFSNYKKGNIKISVINLYKFAWFMAPLYLFSRDAEKFSRTVKLLAKKLHFYLYRFKLGQPDVIHVHSLFRTSDYIIWIKKKFSIPYIVTEHFSGFYRGVFSAKELEIIKKALSNSEFNIAPSKSFCTYLASTFDVDFHYLPNIVDSAFFHPGTNSKSPKFTFLNIAFLHETKNHKGLLRAFKAAFNGRVDVNLVIAGYGYKQKEIETCIEALGLENQVTLYGAATREEVVELIQNSSAVVSSSKFETFGITLIESMSCGKPVIATRCGGPESFVTPDVGILCDYDDQSLSAALSEMVYSVDKYDANHIREYATKNFSPEVFAKKIEKNYRKCLESSP